MPYIDAISNSPGNKTWSHTVGAGDSRLLVVCVGIHNTGSISGVTYGGAAMALAKSQTGNYRTTYIYYLVAPTVGAANVVVTGTDGGYGTACCALSLTGVLQSAPIRSSAGVYGSSYSPSLVIASAVDDLVLDVVCHIAAGTSSAYAPGAGQTEQFDFRVTGGVTIGVSTKDGAASITTSWTATGMTDGNYAMASVSIAPDPLDARVSEGFTISDNIDAFNLSDTLAEGFTISDNIQGGFEYEASTAEGFTIDDAAVAVVETPLTASEDFTINDAIAVDTETTLTEAAGFSDTAIPQMEYLGDPLAQSMGLGAVIEAEFVKPIRRYRFPYRAQGRHLTIKFRNAEPGQTLMLLDVAAKIVPIVGITNSDKTQYRAQGNHLTIKFSNNTLDEVLHLLYCAMTVKKTLQ